MPISRMVDFYESYSPFHVCLTICPFPHLVYATSHLSFVTFYSYLVSWLAMIWACAYYTDFTDGWFLQELLPFLCLFDHISVPTHLVYAVISLSMFFLPVYYTSTYVERVGVSQHDNACSFIIPYMVTVMSLNGIMAKLVFLHQLQFPLGKCFEICTQWFWPNTQVMFDFDF